MPPIEPAEIFDRVNAINLRGVWACMKHDLGQMRTQGSGAIVENASRGIRINAVCPGTIETPMVADMAAKGELDRTEAAAATPIGRLGHGEEIAASVLWQYSPGAHLLCGDHLPKTQVINPGHAGAHRDPEVSPRSV